MNAVLSDVYTWYIISQDKQYLHDIVLFDPCFFWLTYTVLWSLGKDILRTVHVCCKVCLLFLPIKVEKKDKSQSRFYKYFKKISLKNAPNPSNAAIKHKAGDWKHVQD